MSGAGRQDFTEKAGAALKVCSPSPLPISLTRTKDLLSYSPARLSEVHYRACRRYYVQGQDRLCRIDYSTQR